MNFNGWRFDSLLGRSVTCSDCGPPLCRTEGVAPNWRVLADSVGVVSAEVALDVNRIL